MESSPGLAKLFTERAEIALADGKIENGLLYLAEAWRSAEEARNQDWAKFARLSIAAWQPYRSELIAKLPPLLPPLVISPDGSLVIGRHGLSEMQLWSTITGDPIGEPISIVGNNIYAGFSNNSRLYIVACTPPIFGPIGPKKAWIQISSTVEGSRPGQRVDLDGGIVDVAEFSPENDKVLVGSNTRGPVINQAGELIPQLDGANDGNEQNYPISKLIMLSVKTLKPLGEPILELGQLQSATFSPDGSTIAVNAGGNIKFWSTKSLKPLAKLPRDELQALPLQLILDACALPVGASRSYWLARTTNPLSFSPDSKSVLVIESNGRVTQWTTGGEQIGNPFVITSSPGHLAAGPDGKIIVALQNDGTARLWSVARGAAFGDTIPLDSRKLLMFNPSGARLLAVDDDTVGIFATDSGARIGRPLRHDAIVTAAVFSAGGEQVLTADATSMSRLWSVQDGKPIGIPIEGSGDRLSFNRRNARILTYSGAAGNVWHAPLAECSLRDLDHVIGRKLISKSLREDSDIMFSPDGSRALVKALRPLTATDRAQTSRLSQQLASRGDPLEVLQLVNTSTEESVGNPIQIFNNIVRRGKV